MTKKKSLSIISILLLLLTCGMCFMLAGCSSDDFDGSSLVVSGTATELSVGEKDWTKALSNVTVTFTFGYDIEIGDTKYKKGDNLSGTGYVDMTSKGFKVSSIDTSSAGKKQISISYLNKIVYVKCTVK